MKPLLDGANGLAAHAQLSPGGNPLVEPKVEVTVAQPGAEVCMYCGRGAGSGPGRRAKTDMLLRCKDCPTIGN